MTEDWMVEGRCAELAEQGKLNLADMFPKSGPGVTKIVNDVCRLCPVRVLCLQYALDNNIAYGIWGGVTAKRRATMRRESGWAAA